MFDGHGDVALKNGHIHSKAKRLGDAGHVFYNT
jgi:hypothetical protein